MSQSSSSMPQGDLEVGVRCGRCGSDDLYFVACPEHTWAIGSICYGCLLTNKIGDGACPDCGWRGEVSVGGGAR